MNNSQKKASHSPALPDKARWPLIPSFYPGENRPRKTLLQKWACVDWARQILSKKNQQKLNYTHFLPCCYTTEPKAIQIHYFKTFWIMSGSWYYLWSYHSIKLRSCLEKKTLKKKNKKSYPEVLWSKPYQTTPMLTGHGEQGWRAERGLSKSTWKKEQAYGLCLKTSLDSTTPRLRGCLEAPWSGLSACCILLKQPLLPFTELMNVVILLVLRY